jgi:hypothetical protein
MAQATRPKPIDTNWTAALSLVYRMPPVPFLLGSRRVGRAILLTHDRDYIYLHAFQNHFRLQFRSRSGLN